MHPFVKLGELFSYNYCRYLGLLIALLYNIKRSDINVSSYKISWLS